jgi:chemotaxis protein MotB
VLLAKLASEIAKIKNTLLIEGHTDARPFAGQSSYTNWELSTDRANAARRIIEEGGVGADQIVQVRGFANRRLRKPADATDPSNRRVTLIVQPMFVMSPQQNTKNPAGEPKAPEAHQASAAPKPATH